MLFSELKNRVENGEVCITESINGILPEDFIRKNPNVFQTWTCQDDVDRAGIFWIYSPEARNTKEFDVPTTTRGVNHE